MESKLIGIYSDSKYECEDINRRLDKIVYKLRSGLKVGSVDEFGDSPLHLAVRSGREDIVSTIISSGSHIDWQDNNLRTPLHHAESASIARILLENGANVDAQDYQGRTILHTIADCGSYEVAKVLIKFRANLNIQDDDGRSAIHFARTGEMARLLLDNGADIGILGRLDHSLYHSLVTGNRMEAVLVLIDRGVDVQPTLSKCPAWVVKRLLACIALYLGGLEATNDSIGALAQIDLDLRISPIQACEFKTACERELRKLKMYKLNESTSLLDYLSKQDSKFLLDNSLFEDLRRVDIRSFPVFGRMMQVRVAADKVKRNILKSAKDYFTLILKIRSNKLNVNICDNCAITLDELEFRILLHLDEIDLKNMIICGKILEKRNKISTSQTLNVLPDTNKLVPSN